MFSYQTILGFLVFVAGVLFMLMKLKRWMGLLGKFVFAWLNKKMFDLQKELFTSIKEKIFECLPKMAKSPLKVVEIGAGTGANFKYLPKNTEVICIEPNEFSAKYLFEKAAEYPDIKVSFELGVAERMSSVASESVDVVISTHVLCSVSDVNQSLREVLRVLKKGGKFIFMEHIEAVKGSRVHYWQHLLKVPWSFLFQGCTLTRATDIIIQNTGFSNTELDVFDVNFKKFKTLTSLFRRHSAGVATK